MTNKDRVGRPLYKSWEQMQIEEMEKAEQAKKVLLVIACIGGLAAIISEGLKHLL